MVSDPPIEAPSQEEVLAQLNNFSALNIDDLVGSLPMGASIAVRPQAIKKRKAVIETDKFWNKCAKHGGYGEGMSAAQLQGLSVRERVELKKQQR